MYCIGSYINTSELLFQVAGKLTYSSGKREEGGEKKKGEAIIPSRATRGSRFEFVVEYANREVWNCFRGTSSGAFMVCCKNGEMCGKAHANDGMAAESTDMQQAVP